MPAKTGRVQQRNRLLPARLVVYFVLAMCLFSGQSYEEVARLLTAGLHGERRWRASWAVPSSAAIWKAGSRLGVAPLRELFARCAGRLPHRVLRVLSIAAGV
ncbi:transposase domain-containing protein [Streptomyces sp. NPDC085927]|uniref:transposase domain-containing protein n=1 Tax=Streptomyces sp. NPDC085927 TaxID=3365738 RepID=UPI0037D7CC7E